MPPRKSKAAAKVSTQLAVAFDVPPSVHGHLTALAKKTGMGADEVARHLVIAATLRAVGRKMAPVADVPEPEPAPAPPENPPPGPHHVLATKSGTYGKVSVFDAEAADWPYAKLSHRFVVRWQPVNIEMDASEMVFHNMQEALDAARRTVTNATEPTDIIV